MRAACRSAATAPGRRARLSRQRSPPGKHLRTDRGSSPVMSVSSPRGHGEDYLLVIYQRRNASVLSLQGRDTELTPGSIVVVPRSTVGSAMPAEDADRMIVELPLGVVGLTADQIGEVSGVDLRERTSLAALLQSVLGGVMDSELSLRDEVDVFAPVADLLKVTLLSALTPDRATTRYPLAEQIVTYVLDNLTDPGLGAAR
ncbi:hypothetical protein, partial [Dermacoccus nishinomiyaensis]